MNLTSKYNYMSWVSSIFLFSDYFISFYSLSLFLANFTKPLRLSYAERETTIIMVVLPDVGVVLMLTVVAFGHRGRANAGGRESRRGESIPRGMGGAVWWRAVVVEVRAGRTGQWCVPPWGRSWSGRPTSAGTDSSCDHRSCTCLRCTMYHVCVFLQLLLGLAWVVGQLDLDWQVFGRWRWQVFGRWRWHRGTPSSLGTTFKNKVKRDGE